MTIFLRLFCPRGEVAIGLNQYEAPTRDETPDHNSCGNYPTLCCKCMASLTPPANHISITEDEGEGTHNLQFLSEKS